MKQYGYKAGVRFHFPDKICKYNYPFFAFAINLAF
jgi:hypothetical protein